MSENAATIIVSANADASGKITRRQAVRIAAQYYASSPNADLKVCEALDAQLASMDKAAQRAALPTKEQRAAQLMSEKLAGIINERGLCLSVKEAADLITSELMPTGVCSVQKANGLLQRALKDGRILRQMDSKGHNIRFTAVAA